MFLYRPTRLIGMLWAVKNKIIVVKVVHVINMGGFGGAEKLLLQLLPALQQRGQITLLLCYRSSAAAPAKKMKEELNVANLPVIAIEYQNGFRKKFLKDLAKHINEGKYDLVHSHLQHANLWLAILKFKKWISTPVLTTLHGYRDSYQNSHGLIINWRLFFSAYYWMSRWILKKLEGHILISRCLRDFFVSARLLSPVSMKVIYHGYELPPNSSAPVTDSTGRLKNPQIALPGRLIQLKGHLFAIEMLRQLQPRFPGMRLHFFGDGPYKDDIVKAIERTGLRDAVVLHGYVHDLQASLKKCQLAVLPSIYESFGLVFLDCFAAGLPVVAFDLPAGNEIVVNGETGLLTKPRCSDGLTKAVADLCEDADLRNRLKKNGWHALTSQFSMHRMAEEYWQYYSELSQNSRH